MRTSLILLLVLSPLALSAGNKKGVPVARRPDLTVDAPVTLVAARQQCANYAWAAALETLLAAQQVNLDQDYWVDKADGGRCVDTPAGLEQTARLLDGEYTLPTPEGAVKARLTAKLSLGPPALADPLIASLQHGQPVLLVWNDHPYVLNGALYDEWVYPNGQRRLQIRELRLLDPAAPPARRRTADNSDVADGVVVFHADSDDPSTIAGTLIVTVAFCPMNTITCR